MNGPALFVARAEGRRHWRALALLAVVTALGLGAGIAALNSAVRTRAAYGEYLERNDVADLVVNPSLLTSDVDAAIRSLPHVRSVASSTFFNAGAKLPGPMTLRDINEAPSSQLHGSADGRFSDLDRPAVAAGRLPTGPNEVAVSVDYREQLDEVLGRHVEVGDTIPVEFFVPGGDPTSDVDLDAVIEPIGIEQLRVAGFITLADEVLADGLFPRWRMIVSADVADRYDCLPELDPGSEDVQAIFATLAPPQCASQYRYYAIDVDSPANVDAVTAEINRRVDELDEKLPKALKEFDFGYFLIPTTRAAEENRVDDAIRPTVVALALFGLLATIATLAVVMLVAARMARRSASVVVILRGIGAGRRDRALAIGLPVFVAVIAGVAGAVMFAWLASPIGVVGDVRAVDPHPGFALGALLAVGVGAGFIVMFAVALAIATHLVGRRAISGQSERAARRLPVLAAAGPAVNEGTRAALGTERNTGSRLLIAGCAIAVTVGVAAAVFGANVSRLLDEPDRYGWPWDVAALTGFGYGDADATKIDADLAKQRDVERWSYVGFAGDGSINGVVIPQLIGLPGDHAFRPWLRSGRLPVTPGELVVGETTARDLDLAVGDRVETANRFGGTEGEVVGIAVLPAIGPFLSDRSGPGVGAYVVVDPKGLDPSWASFVGVDLVAGADPAVFLAGMQSKLRGWDLSETSPFTYNAPVRPPSIANVAATQNSPLILTIVLAAALFFGLGLSIGLSVSERRRELAVFRALGFTARQVRTSVRVQALTMIGIGLVFGLPFGILLGRWSWTVFADQLGVADDATVPVAALVLLSVIAIGAALVAAAIPARRAGRIQPASELRAQ